VKNFEIKSYCKINLFLRVVSKLKNGYHNIKSLITWLQLYDVISVEKSNKKKDEINFSGNFKSGIDNKANTVTKLLSLLRKNNYLKEEKFKINIKKNIPHGSGLGGGSSNAADLLNYFNLSMKLELSQKNIKKIANKIGSDVPLALKRKNTFLTGKKNEMRHLNKRFKLNLLIIYPNEICSTKKIYTKNQQIGLSKPQPLFNFRNKKQLISILIKENNDLEETVNRIYPKVRKVVDLIKSQKGCYFSRITGSGSACFGIFSNMKNAIYAQKMIKRKNHKYWCAVSKTM